MAGFSVDYNFGKLTVGSLTIPNAAIRLQGHGIMDMWSETLTGSDREVVDGLVAVPRKAHGLRVSVPLIVRDDCSTAGVAASNRVQQLRANLGSMAAIAATSKTSTQTVSIVPYVGASTLTGAAIVMPPEVGDPIPGVGVRVVWDMVFPGGPPS